MLPFNCKDGRILCRPLGRQILLSSNIHFWVHCQSIKICQKSFAVTSGQKGQIKFCAQIAGSYLNYLLLCQLLVTCNTHLLIKKSFTFNKTTAKNQSFETGQRRELSHLFGLLCFSGTKPVCDNQNFWMRWRQSACLPQ